MVQSASWASVSKQVSSNWNIPSKKVDSVVDTKRPSDRQDNKTKGQEEKDKYGAWGPIFKNKDHFASLHHC